MHSSPQLVALLGAVWGLLDVAIGLGTFYLVYLLPTACVHETIQAQPSTASEHLPRTRRRGTKTEAADPGAIVNKP